MDHAAKVVIQTLICAVVLLAFNCVYRVKQPNRKHYLGFYKGVLLLVCAAVYFWFADDIRNFTFDIL